MCWQFPDAELALPVLQHSLWAHTHQAPYLIFFIPMTSKSAMLPSIPDTSKVVLPHPFETFRPLTNCSNFGADVICPAICAAHSQAELSQAPDPGHPVFSVPHLLWKRLFNFFLKLIIIIPAINIIFLLFLLQNFLWPFLWLTQWLLWPISVTNTRAAMCGRVDFLRKGLMLCWVWHIGKWR